MCESKNEILYLPIIFRLYPTEGQEILFNKTVGCCRLIFNQALGHTIKEYKKQKESSFKGKKLNVNDLITRLPSIKAKHDWLAEVDSTSLQQSLLDFKQAFKNFWTLNKKGKHSGFPKFKSKHKA